MVSTRTPAGRTVERPALPTWIKPQLAALVKVAPDGNDWLHEIKFDGYRMHARLDAGRVQIVTRRGNIWTDKYPAIAEAIAAAFFAPLRARARGHQGRVEGQGYRQPVRAPRRAAVGIDATSSTAPA